MSSRFALRFRAAVFAAGFALAVVAVEAGPRPATVTAITPASAAAAVATPPATLGETGFDALAGERLAFAPQYPLWSDGAHKRRWIYLPPGTWIDATDGDAWQFPVGTRLWKEFSFGRPVETRYMERRASGWIYATYVWNPAGTEATLAPARGVTTDVEVAPGVTHVVPGAGDCVACHGNGATPVLGMSALQLSVDRDPGALHREPPIAGAIDLAGLVATGRVRNLRGGLVAAAPRIAAGTPVERAALGYLHGNCSSCHRPDGPLATLAMSLRAPDAIATAVGQHGRFALRTDAAERTRITPGAPAQSVLLARIASRSPALQMPPIGTGVVDAEAVALITAWIEQLDDHL
ncbi:MAG TPA: hypothetical protein VM734_04255 [Kofleriaceae bacterium]|nr:hypothetical protein [Kofleriaceae bacterium]